MNLPTFDRIPGAIAVDLDGTLLNSRTQLSERNRMAIRGCVACGIPVSIATSRPIRTLRRLVGDNLTNICSLVIMTGAVGRAAPPLSGAFREVLPTGVAKGIVDLLVGMGPEVRVTVEIEGWEFGANWAADAETLWRLNAATPDMVTSVDEALTRNPAKIAISRGGGDISDLAAEVSRRYGDIVSVVPANGMTFLNILSIRASKSGALRHLLMSRDIAMADVLAFGDDIPDVDLLTSCGTAVAMANAVPEVLSLCSYSTTSNDDDGVAVVLERVLTISGLEQ
ncbi:MAG: HAD hydrolase family protein [Dehalococcoidales bacterium]|nr:HAD hydrolase family protein [Dehalococcoidales bacterium]